MLLSLWAPRDVAGEEQRARIALQLTTSLPEPTARALRDAIAAQLAGIALIDSSDPQAGALVVRLLIARSAHGIALQFTDREGRALAAPRLLPGPLGEVSTSEIATIVYAFVVAQSAPEATEREQTATPSPALTTNERGAPPAADGKAASQPAMVKKEDPQARRRSDSQTPSARRSSSSSRGPSKSGATPPGSSSKSDASSRSPLASERSPQASEVASLAWERLPQPWRMRLVALYTGTHEAPELPWHDGVRAEARVRLFRGLYAGAGYAYFPAVDLTRASTTVRLQTHGLSALMGLERAWTLFDLGADIGFGLTATRRETRSTATPFLTRAPPSERWDPGLAFRLHVRVRSPNLARLALELAPALELSFRRRELAVEDSRESVVLSPYWVRARVDLGACFDLL